MKRDYSKVPDRDLIAACIEGDGEAWAALLRRYQRLIYSVPIRYGFTQEDAADIFQNVCLVLLNSLARLREPDRLGSWLITVTRRECGRHKRSWTQEHLVGEADDDELLADVPDPGLLPDDLCVQWEHQQRLRQAVERLPERDRRLVQYLFYELRGYEEIAERLHMPVSSIGPTRGRVLKKLKDLLAAPEPAQRVGQPPYGARRAAAGNGNGALQPSL